MMRYLLYTVFVWLAGFDLAIAETSGNLHRVKHAREDLTYWEGELAKLEIQQ